MQWFFDPANQATLGGYGFILAVFGTALTLIGLFFTFREAKAARRNARSAEEAVENFKFRSDHYDAYRDLAQAAYAMETTRRHLNNDAWRDAVDSYDEARRAILRVLVASLGLTDEQQRQLSLVTSHMQNFCNAVDTATSGRTALPDKTKVFTTIRRHYGVIMALQKSLEERVG